MTPEAAEAVKKEQQRLKMLKKQEAEIRKEIAFSQLLIGLLKGPLSKVKK